MSAFQEVCRVGYALNPKKLRKAKGEDDSTATAAQAEKQGPWCGGGLATIVGLDQQGDNVDEGAGVDGVVFAPLTAGGDFHVILHKLTEDLEAHPSSSPHSESDKLRVLREYLLSHPAAVVVDPLDNVRTVVNRAHTCACLQRIQQRLGQGAAGCPFAQPAFAVADGSLLSSSSSAGGGDSAAPPARSGAILATMRAAGLAFPVICKPLQACGTPESHSMAVVFSSEGFADLMDPPSAGSGSPSPSPKPFLLQQFCDHGGVFYKVYVLDGEVLISTRRSLPDFERSMHDLLAAGVAVTAFDSRVSFPELPLGLREGAGQGSKESKESKEREQEEHRQQHGKDKQNACSDASTCTEIDHEVVPAPLQARIAAAAAEISAEFGLSLYGFDVIVPLPASVEEGGVPPPLLVIDVNFFPSYKNVPDFPSKLRAYLRRAAQLPPWREA